MSGSESLEENAWLNVGKRSLTDVIANAQMVQAATLMSEPEAIAYAALFLLMPPRRYGAEHHILFLPLECRCLGPFYKYFGVWPWLQDY